MGLVVRSDNRLNSCIGNWMLWVAENQKKLLVKMRSKTSWRILTQNITKTGHKNKQQFEIEEDYKLTYPMM